MSTDLAWLITRGLCGHLHGFLPGNDNKAAVSHAVASRSGWSGPGTGVSEVSREGIGHWPDGVRCGDRKPSTADLFVSWDEVLAVIARGCPGGHRERYEAAYAAWCGGVREAWDNRKPGEYPSPGAPDATAIRDATAALIRHGCGKAEVQGELFRLAEVSP